MIKLKREAEAYLQMDESSKDLAKGSIYTPVPSAAS